MAGSLNRVSLLGNVGKDPEIRTTQSGARIANLTVATSESWKDKTSGEKKEQTEWHRVVCFNDGLVGVIERFVKKGSKVFVEGQLQTRKWTDQSGQERYSTEVVIKAFGGQLILLGDRQSGDSGSSRQEARPAQQQQRPAERSAAPAYTGPAGDLNDEIPF